MVRAAESESIANTSSHLARATLAVAASQMLATFATPGPVPAHVSALSLDVAATCVTAVELVVTRARYEQHAGFYDCTAPPLRIGHARRPASQQVQVAHLRASVEFDRAAQYAAVNGAGTQVEALERRRQAVRHEMN